MYIVAITWLKWAKPNRITEINDLSIDAAQCHFAPFFGFTIFYQFRRCLNLDNYGLWFISLRKIQSSFNNKHAYGARAFNIVGVVWIVFSSTYRFNPNSEADSLKNSGKYVSSTRSSDHAHHISTHLHTQVNNVIKFWFEIDENVQSQWSKMEFTKHVQVRSFMSETKLRASSSDLNYCFFLIQNLIEIVCLFAPFSVR